jgi:hypothetical protein
MQRAMARQAEAERGRRAKIIDAEGEYQASEKLAQAAEVIARHPIAYQLRYLQTVTEVSAEKNSTLVIPIPIELLAPVQAAFGKDMSTFDVGPAVPGAAAPGAQAAGAAERSSGPPTMPSATDTSVSMPPPSTGGEAG